MATSVTCVSPVTAVAAGGTTISIAGSGFSGTVTVELGGSSCTDVSVSGNEISCVTPAMSVGFKDLAVTSDEGTAVITKGLEII